MPSLRWRRHPGPGIGAPPHGLHRTGRLPHIHHLRRFAACFGPALACWHVSLRVSCRQISMVTRKFGIHPLFSSALLSWLRIPPAIAYDEVLRDYGRTSLAHSSSWCRRITLPSLPCIPQLPRRQDIGYEGELGQYLPPRSQVSPLVA